MKTSESKLELHGNAPPTRVVLYHYVDRPICPACRLLSHKNNIRHQWRSNLAAA